MKRITGEFSTEKLIRNNGAAYRADRFPSPFTAVEHPVGERFMTTVEKNSVGKYHIFMLLLQRRQLLVGYLSVKVDDIQPFPFFQCPIKHRKKITSDGVILVGIPVPVAQIRHGITQKIRDIQLADLSCLQ